MRRNESFVKGALWGLALAGLPMVAWADSVHPLLDNSTAIQKGSKSVQGMVVQFGGADFRQLNVTVDYAVFAPGTFASDSFFSLAGGGLNASDYVYAYQVFCDQPTGNLTGLAMSALYLGIGKAQPSAIGYDASFDPGTSDVAPGDLDFGDGSIQFKFPYSKSNSLLPGTHSALLLVSSQGGPRFGPFTVVDGGTSAVDMVAVPSAVPLPAGAWVGLVVLGGMGLVYGLRSRQNATM